MKKNNLSLDFSLENRIYCKTFKKIIKIILIYLIFKLILSLYFMFNVYMFKQEFLYGKKLEFIVDEIGYKIDTLEEKKEIINLITDFSNKSSKVNILSYKCLPRVEIFTDSYYVNAYEYNLSLGKQCMLIEVGAQTNTYQEAKNAAEPLAVLIKKVLGE